MSSLMDSDEALARYLQEQENERENEFYLADLEPARRLQQNDSVVQQNDDSTVVNLTSNHSDLEDNFIKTYYSKNTWSKEFDDDNSSYLLAVKLQREEYLNTDLALAKELNNKVDDSILNDEIPDLHQLFLYFNEKYFDHKLDMIEVKWSTKMTRCAGTCTYRGLGNCIIALSEPILKFRPKKDMFETLLHEMIHALLFITENNTDRDGHGPEFLKEAKRVSEAANVNITVYHNFHNEVRHYLTHVWQCNGVCRDRPPYFGIVKRAMNRPPQPADSWYAQHQLTCGGTFTKIAAPPPKEQPPKKKKRLANTLDIYFANVDEKMKKPTEF